MNLARIEHDAQQALAFADGYEEASVLLAAALLDAHGWEHDLARVARRVRSLAYDTLALTAEVEAWRASRTHLQSRLWEA